MAVYKIFPLQDTTIYSAYPGLNTGLDAILEMSNLNPPTSASANVSRALIQFDQNDIENVIDNLIPTGSMNFSSSLKVYIADASGVTMPSTIQCFPISQSWNNGTGYYLNHPQTRNGCCWYSRLSSGSGNWANNDNLNPFTSASYSGSDVGGGTWFTGSGDSTLTLYSSQDFNVRTSKDINLNVTDTVKIWYTSSKGVSGPTGRVDIDNEGFILKWSSLDQPGGGIKRQNIEFNNDLAVQPDYKSYSVDTNTIYPPCLEIKWDDQNFETGSLPEIATTDVFISLDTNPGVFYSESINRFRLNVRPEFPARVYLTRSIDTVNHYLNSSSLYAIKDLDTNEFVVDFDQEFTKISCDSTSNYFDVYMNGLEPERYYQILIQTTISGSTIVKNDDYYFKVVNG
jgi:hypothetical protein|tara:strand:+ start:10619 stop:11815 length:1197 start_codon:yes stop_codon:yes gene_type:complete